MAHDKRLTIRAFDPGCDYPDLVRVVNAAYPAFRFTAVNARSCDQREPAFCLRARWVAEVGGRLVGAGGYEQRSDMYAEGRYEIRLYVSPERQGEGIGNALYEIVLDALSELSPREYRSFCQEVELRAMRFFAARGFVEKMRDNQAALDLTRFDPRAWPSSLPEGVTLRNYGWLRARPDFVERLCDLHNEILAEVPPLGVRSPLRPDDFARRFLESADICLEGSCAALAPDGALVGVSELRAAPDGTTTAILVGLTGVRREWRGKGVARALKLAAIGWATAGGYTEMRTVNALASVSIMTLNASLGFVTGSGRVHLARAV
jgi:GNAT superfamily N-acetyltransferase